MLPLSQINLTTHRFLEPTNSAELQLSNSFPECSYSYSENNMLLKYFLTKANIWLCFCFWEHPYQFESDPTPGCFLGWTFACRRGLLTFSFILCWRRVPRYLFF